MSVSEQQPWHAAYPEPTSTAVFLPQATVLGWMESSEKIAGHDFVLVDLRRSDHEVGLILLFVSKKVLVSSPGVILQQTGVARDCTRLFYRLDFFLVFGHPGVYYISGGTIKTLLMALSRAHTLFILFILFIASRASPPHSNTYVGVMESCIFVFFSYFGILLRF